MTKTGIGQCRDYTPAGTVQYGTAAQYTTVQRYNDRKKTKVAELSSRSITPTHGLSLTHTHTHTHSQSVRECQKTRAKNNDHKKQIIQCGMK